MNEYINNSLPITFLTGTPKTLIALGISIDCLNSEGKSPFELAIQNYTLLEKVHAGTHSKAADSSYPESVKNALPIIRRRYCKTGKLRPMYKTIHIRIEIGYFLRLPHDYFHSVTLTIPQISLEDLCRLIHA